MKIKLSERASLLLWIVGQRTERNWETGELLCFFYPHPTAIYYKDSGKHCTTYISGSGDANALRGLMRKGLIEHQQIHNHAYALTEDGLLALEELGLNERFS